MAYRYLFPSAVALGGSLAYVHSSPRSPFRIPTYHCDSTSVPSSFSSLGLPWFQRKQMAPAPPRDHSGFAPTTYRQISTGSFFGVAVGLMVARFGGTIALIVGGVMILIETLARQGVDLLPYDTIRRWAGNVDVRGLVMKNTPFKLSHKMMKS
ncbi:hypothetical protein EDC01DRAFT_614984 [Geopyxis carbonaria]|nr:hypothetical protein EDC01DRAFT_614984 [Geopyxis carbonaria]